MRTPSRQGRLASAALFLALLGAGATAFAESAALLRFDPFRPLPKEIERGTQNSPGNATSTFSPSLRSTVVAGDKSLANLGGEILGLGEEKKGYRLVEVRPFEAVFEKDGKLILIQVENLAGEGK